ncbi:MAG: TonB-dependent receptor [Pseudomonadota bacterium]
MKLRQAAAIAAGVALAGTAATTRAQDTEELTLQLPEILVEADNRVETPLDETTRSVTVVTEEEIEAQRSVTRNIGGIISNTTPGFSPSTEAQTNFGQTLRGRNFLTLIDGVPQSTPLRDGQRSLNSVDAASVERIEIIRGGTAVYGFGATGGLVNIITKRPDEGTFNANARAGLTVSATRPVADSIGYEGSADMSGRVGAFDYALGGSYAMKPAAFDAEGDRIPAQTLGGQGGLSDADSINLFGKIGFNFDEDRQRIQIGALYYDFEQDSEWAGVSFAGDPSQDIKTPAVFGDFNPVNPGTENVNATVEYSHSDLFGSTLKAQAFYTDLDVIFGKFPPFAQTRIESEKLGGRVTVNTPVPLEVLPFEVTWGIDLLSDETKQTATDGPTTSPFADQFAIAGFAQLDVPVGRWGKISGGIRHEAISIDVSDFTNVSGNPVNGGELKYNETLFNLTGTVFVTDEIDIYGGFSQGFTVADIVRSIRDGSFANATEAEAEAQRTNNYELGIRYAGGRIEASAVGFLSTSDNGTTFEVDTINIQKQPERIYGVEATIGAQVLEGLRLGGTFTWLRGRVDTNDDGEFNEDLPSTRVPPIKLTAFADWLPLDGVTTRVQVTHVGSRSPDSTAFGGTSDIDSYTVVDAYATVELGPGEVQLGVNNLFNADYTPLINQAYDSSFAYARGPGTTISLAYSVSF